MPRLKEGFAIERLRHRLASWNREFDLGMSKADAEILLAAARDIVRRRIEAEDDPF